MALTSKDEGKLGFTVTGKDGVVIELNSILREKPVLIDGKRMSRKMLVEHSNKITKSLMANSSKKKKRKKTKIESIKGMGAQRCVMP